jgi:hypothetical protein
MKPTSQKVSRLLWNRHKAYPFISLSLVLMSLWSTLLPLEALAASDSATSLSKKEQDSSKKEKKLEAKPSALFRKAFPSKAPKEQPKALAPSVDASKLTTQTKQELQNFSNSLHEQNQSIANELQDEQELSNKDIAILWQAAVERSGTIRYAIEKLSRRDATGKPVANDNFSKRMLQSVARVGGAAGSLMTGTPAGILGGNLVEEMMRDTATDPNLLKVTDADMLILAKEVEALQNQVVESYYNYLHAQERWKISKEAHQTLDPYYQRYATTPHTSPEAKAIEPLMNSLSEATEQDVDNAKQSFVQARNTLGLLVGGDVLVAMEKLHSEEGKKTSQTIP